MSNSQKNVEFITNPEAEFDVNKFDRHHIEALIGSKSSGFPKYEYESGNAERLSVAAQNRTLDYGGIQQIGEYNPTDMSRTSFFMDVKKDNTDPIYVTYSRVDEDTNKRIEESKKDISKYPLRIVHEGKEMSILEHPDMKEIVDEYTTVKKGKKGKKDKKTVDVESIIKYVPIIRTKRPKPGSKGVKHERIKVRFNIKKKKVEENGKVRYDPESITTKLFKSGSNKEIKADKPSDFEQYFRYKCEFSILTQLVRSWFIMGDQPYQWGYNIHADQIEVSNTPGGNGGGGALTFKDNIFATGGESETSDQDKNEDKETGNNKKKEEKKEEDDSEDSEDSEEESEDEEESDDDNEEEEEEDGSDDGSDSEEDSEEEEEDEEPPKKTKKGKSKK